MYIFMTFQPGVGVRRWTWSWSRTLLLESEFNFILESESGDFILLESELESKPGVCKIFRPTPTDYTRGCAASTRRNSRFVTVFLLEHQSRVF